MPAQIRKTRSGKHTVRAEFAAPEFRALRSYAARNKMSMGQLVQLAVREFVAMHGNLRTTYVYRVPKRGEPSIGPWVRPIVAINGTR